MASGKPVGTAYAEIDLDSNKMEKGLQRVHDSLVSGTIKTEDAFKQLGIKSDSVYDKMRANAELAFNKISESSKSTANDIIRAEQSKADQLTRIQNQQYGNQITLLDKLKGNYLAMSAIAVAAWALVNKAISDMDEGAKALQIGSSFKIVAKEMGAESEHMIESMQDLTRHTVDESTLQQKATKLMLAGYNPEQIVKFSSVAITASEYMGTSVSESFDRISDALATRMPKAMVQAGAITREQMKVVSAAIEAGATQADLMALAITNLEIKQLKLKGTMDEATLSIQRFHAEVKNLGEEIGQIFIRAAQILFGAVELYAGSMQAIWATAKGVFLDQSANMSKAFDTIQKGIDNITGSAKTEAAASAESIKNKENERDKQLAALQAIIDAKKNADKIDNDVMKAAMDRAKAYYETETAQESRWKEKQREAGADELALVTEDYNRKNAIIDIEYEMEKTAINDTVKRETEKAALLAKLDTDYTKKVEANKSEFQKELVSYTQKHLDTMASLYKTIDQYSNDSVNAELDQVKQRYIKEGAFASATAEQLKILAQAEAAAELKIIQDNELAKAMAHQDLYAKTDGMRSDQFEKAYQETVKSEADILEVKMKALNQYFDKAKWIQDQLAKHSGGEFQQDMQDVATGMQSISSGFEQLSQMYSESSSERKKFHDASMAFNIIEKAAMVAKTMSAAVLAVAEQAGSGPYVGFVAMAAMAAAMASLLATVGIAFSGGGSSSSASASAKSYNTGANGAPLGSDTTSGSQSIADSYKLLKDTYTMEDTKLTHIYEEMKNLNNNITTVITSIARTGGLTGVSIPASTPNGSGFSEIWNQAWGGLDFIGNYVNSIMNSVFGGGTQSWVAAQGFAIGAGIVQDILNGAQVSVRQFAGIMTQTNGGWFSSDHLSETIQYSAANQQVVSAINQVYKSMSNTLVQIAQGLGSDVAAVLNYTFAAANIDLIGLSTEDMNKKINEYFSTLMDKAVYDLFGAILSQYQKIDEGLLQTAIRLITDKETILKMLELTNQAYTGDTTSAIALSESLINLAGDLTKLTDAANTYYDKFHTDAEKQADLQKSLTEEMTSMNQTLPTTREGYKALMESIDLSGKGFDLTTEAGQAAYLAQQKLYVMLLEMSGAADQYYSELEKLAKALADNKTAYTDYYNQMMGNQTALEKQISDDNAKWMAYYSAAEAAGASTEELTKIMQMASDTMNQLIATYVKTLVQPFVDLGMEMYSFAQGIAGLTTEVIARSTFMLTGFFRNGTPYSGDMTAAGIEAASNSMNSDQIKNYVADLSTYFSTVAKGLEQVYQALQATKKSLLDSIQSLTTDLMDNQQKVDYYLAQAVAKYNTLAGLPPEQMSDAIKSIQDDAMAYYASEKQIITDKYNTEIEAIKSKNSAELANIEAVRQKLMDLTYSGYNLAVPKAKVETAQQDYAKLFAAAQTGDSTAVSSFLSFTDTYLKAGQDAYKSSQQYLDMYAKVMADIGSLDTHPGVSIEDLTTQQNALIADQTAQMTADLQSLSTSVVAVLNQLGTIVDSSMNDVALQYAGIFQVLEQLVADGYGINIPGLGSYADGGTASGPDSGYLAILHGTETITPRGKGVSASGSKGYDDPEIKNLLTALVVQGTRDQSVKLVLEDGTTLKGFVRREADQLDQDRLEKGIKKRNYI